MIDECFEECLYFTVAKLSRIITKMAEETFSIVGVSPNYAFLLMVVHEKKCITPTELSEVLHIAPSTTTRFLDKLESKGYIKRSASGKCCGVSLTEKGEEIQKSLDEAWEQLHDKYTSILGEKEVDKITKVTSETAKKLER